MDEKLLKKMFKATKAPMIHLSLQKIPLRAKESKEGISVSNTQPQVFLKLHKRRAELVVIPARGEYILKPGIPHYPNVPENENCCMDIAATLGFDVPPHCLLPLQDGSLAYITKCLDMQNGKRVRQKDFCQILRRENKYSAALEEIGGKFKEISTDPKRDIQLFFERVLLHFIVGHGDSHLQNYSIFIPDSKSVRFSPVFDIVSSKLYVRREVDSALMLNGKKNNLTREDFDAFAEFLKIPMKNRYQKFEGKFRFIEFTILKSSLPENYQKKLIAIVRSQFARLNLNL